MRRLHALIIPLTLCLSAISSASAQSLDRETLRWINKHPRVDSIEINGNLYFSDGEIQGRMFSRRYTTFMGIPSARINYPRAVYVQRESIARDTAEIKALYYSAGFPGLRLRELLIPLPDTNALIRVDIEEGRRFHIGGLRVLGDVPEPVRSGLSRAMRPLKVNQPLNIIIVRQAQFFIKEAFADEGYPYATVEYTLDTSAAPDSAIINYHVSSDSVVHFGEITIDSAPRFGVGTVRRELKIKTDALYRRRDLLESQRRLVKSGFFTSAQIEPTDTVTADSSNRYRPSFRVSVKERRANYWSLLTGVSQDTVADIIMFGQGTWGKRNFLRNRRVELGGTGSVSNFSGEYFFSHRYRFRYTQPWLFGVSMPATIKVEFEPGVKSPLQPFRIQRSRLDFSLNREFSDTRSISFGAQYEAVSIFDVDVGAEDSIRQSIGISVRRKLYFSFKKDSRNDLFVPSSGQHVEFKSDFAGGFLGGDESFVRFEGSWSRYRPSVWRSIFASRIRSGYSFPFGKSSFVPAIDRFFVGGANTIRGFSKDELGPLTLSEAGDIFALGGEFYVIANAEFRRPIVRQFWGSLFFDAGNAWEDVHDPLISFDGAAYSYGAGMQFHSPAGPIRLDYGQRIQTKRYAADHRWHFSILYAF